MTPSQKKAEEARQKKEQEKKLGILPPGKLSLGVTFEVVEYKKPSTNRTKSSMSQMIQNTKSGNLITIIYPGGIIDTSASWLRIEDLRVKIIHHSLDLEWTGYYNAATDLLNGIIKCKQL